jgi:adenylate cyclase
MADRVIDLADGDPRKGQLVIESPLSIAVMFRSVIRMCRGVSGWRHDVEQAAAMIRESVPLGEAPALYWKYAFAVLAGAVRADAAAVRETAEILERAEQRGDDLSLECARILHGLVLAQQDEPEKGRGRRLLAAAREAAAPQRSVALFTTVVDIELARAAARTDDVDHAIDVLATIIENETADLAIGMYGLAEDALAQTLLRRGTPEDVEAAESAIERLAAVPTEPGFVLYEVVLLRLRALLARARGDPVGYRHLADSYRAMATEFGFEGHMDMAEAMA